MILEQINRNVRVSGMGGSASIFPLTMRTLGLFRAF